MAYIEPLVMVYQEYANLTTTTRTASLPACIIGPCYHIIDPVEDEEQAFAGRYTAEGLENATIPGMIVGANIDANSVVVRVKGPRLLVLSDAAIKEITANAFVLRAAADLKVGDYVKFTKTVTEKIESTDDDGNTVITDGETTSTVIDEEASYRIVSAKPVSKYSKDIVYTVNLSLPAEVDAADCTISVERLTSDIIMANGDSGLAYTDHDAQNALSFSMNKEAGTFSILNIEGAEEVRDAVTGEVTGYNAYPVVSGALYVGYRAMRSDLDAMNTVSSVDEAQALLGRASSANPLALGVDIALANTDTPVHCIAVDTDDLVGWTKAKDVLEEYSPVYGIAPLTTDPGYLKIFADHAKAMAEPEIGEWRVAIGCSEMVDRIELCKGTGKLATDGADSPNLNRIDDRSGTFASSGVNSGCVVAISKCGADGEPVEDAPVYEFVVKEAVTDDILTVDPTGDFGDNNDINPKFVAGDVVSYTVYRAATKNDQAKAIADTSRSYGDRRYVNIWPDTCIIDGNEEPGYYLSCALAGAISALQPHYPLTRTSLAGISAVKHSGDYFNKTQLNMIADGGTFIFVQSAPTAVPHIRHQLTTDRSSTEFQELSMVKTFDYVCYILKDVLDEYIGKWNITEQTLAAIKTAVAGTLETLRLSSTAKIGSPVISYSVDSVRQLEDVRDRVEVYCTVEFPYPLNTIGLHVISA